MRFRFNDGKVIEAQDALDFVIRMNNASFAHRENHREFMQDCVSRGKQLGLDLRASDEQEFLTSLIENGVVKPVFPHEGEN